MNLIGNSLSKFFNMKRKVKLIFQTWLQEIIIRTSLQDNKDRDKILKL